MSKTHGTTNLCTNGQFATIASRLLIALPNAIKSSELDIKAILSHTSNGERLELAIAEALKMLHSGHVATIPQDHTIDCSASPFVPDGYHVEEHLYLGSQWKWNPEQVSLYKDEDNQLVPSACLRLETCREKLKGKLVLNANVLDYLLENEHLIPDKWKSGCIVFFGTIFKDKEGCLYVRDLAWDGHSKWTTHIKPLSTPIGSRLIALRITDD